MDELEIELQKAEAAQQQRTKEAKELEDELTLADEVVQAPATRGWFSDSAAGAVTGVAKAITSTIDGIAAVTDKIPEHFGDAGIRIDGNGVRFYYQSPEEFVQYRDTHENILTAPTRAVEDAVGAPQTTPGKLTQGITQFVTGLLGTKKFFNAYGILRGTSKSVIAARSLAESAVASGVAFSGHDENVANLIEATKAEGGVPDLSNTLSAMLATKADDSELEGRFKNMLADAGVGVLADAAIGGVRAYRAGKQARQAAADDIAAEIVGNKVEVDIEREIKFADDTGPLETITPQRSPKTGDIVEITQDSPAVDLKLSTPPFPGRTELSLVDDVTSPEQLEVDRLTSVADKATAVADDAKQAIDSSKPAPPLKDMGRDEAYDALREKLGITEDKLAQIRADVEAGKIGKEDVADLLHFNPSKFDWSAINDPESQVALMNTFTRVFADALGKAGTGRVSLDTIFAQANKIGADVDASINLWQRLQGVEAGVRAQQFVTAASGAHLDRLAKRIAGGSHTAQDLLDFVVHEKRHSLLQLTAQGSRSMIGRALRVMREGTQVSEATLKVANGRRLRTERKAREVATKAGEAVKVAKEKASKREAAKKARDTAAAAEKAHADAKAQVELDEQELAEITRKYLDKAHRDRLLQEQRAAVNVAKEAVKTAEREAKAAAEVARKAEAEAAQFENAADKRFGNNDPTAEVNLSGDTKLQFDEVAAALRNMGLDPEHVVDLAKEVAKRESSVARNAAARTGVMMKLQDRVSFLYINNILSGLPTMAINISSGFLKMVESTFEHFGAGALAAARGDKYALLAANKAAVATWTSWGSAWKLAASAWKEGMPQTDIMSRAEVSIRSGGNQSTIEKAISVPSRAIITIDEFFKHIFYQQELNARAIEVAATAAQLQPSAAAQRAMFKQVYKETLDNPPDDIVLDSIEKARYQTFQANLESKFANNLIRLTNDTPIAKLVIPFIKTPTNIIKQGIVERTPLSLLRSSVLEEIRAGTRDGNMAIVRVALGTALIGTVWNLADQGTVTGSKGGYGRNLNTGDVENIPPYSIYLFGKWYQYNRLDPFGTVLGLTADLRLAKKYAEEAGSNDISTDDLTLSESFGNVLAILNKNLLDKTFFKGISDFTTAVTESRSGADALGRYLQTIGTSLVPYSSFTRNIAKAHDEYAREAFTFSDKLLSQIPGLSESLPVQRDVLGRPLKNADRLGPAWVSPFLVAADDPDPAARELASLKMTYAKAERDIAGVRLSAIQYSRLQQVRGEFLHNQLSKWIGAGEWSALTKHQKIEHVRTFLERGGSEAKKTVMQEWPELGEAVRNLKVEAKAIKSGALQ